MSSIQRYCLAFIGLAAMATAVAQVPGAKPSNPMSSDTVHWTATLSVDVKQGGTATLELSGAILDGWHVYALTQPSGGPTALRISVDDNDIATSEGAPAGPTPQKRRDPSFGITSQFYTHTFTVRLPLRLKHSTATGKQSLPVSVRFQTCSDRECQPPTTVHLTVPVEVLPGA